MYFPHAALRQRTKALEWEKQRFYLDIIRVIQANILGESLSLTAEELCDMFTSYVLSTEHFVAYPDFVATQPVTVTTAREAGYDAADIRKHDKATPDDNAKEFLVLIASSGDIEVWCEILAGAALWNILSIAGLEIVYDGISRDRDIISISFS